MYSFWHRESVCVAVPRRGVAPQKGRWGAKKGAVLRGQTEQKAPLWVVGDATPPSSGRHAIGANWTSAMKSNEEQCPCSML